MAFLLFGGIRINGMGKYRQKYRHNSWIQPYHNGLQRTIGNKKAPIFKGLRYCIVLHWIVIWCPKPESYNTTIYA
jgi:hypothetical protein